MVIVTVIVCFFLHLRPHRMWTPLHASDSRMGVLHAQRSLYQWLRDQLHAVDAGVGVK